MIDFLVSRSGFMCVSALDNEDWDPNFGNSKYFILYANCYFCCKTFICSFNSIDDLLIRTESLDDITIYCIRQSYNMSLISLSHNFCFTPMLMIRIMMKQQKSTTVIRMPIRRKLRVMILANLFICSPLFKGKKVIFFSSHVLSLIGSVTLASRY